ncbi:MAG: MFS transporter [Deltaproteobacteria bacterium]|nr:MFS transporter [Deltaproteobacteria bacterium]
MNKQKSFLGLSKNVRSLGWVSFFNDIASEMIYPLLPLFLNTVLGAGVVFIGVIEGIAESVSSFLKLFSGWVSDRFQKRKGLILFGYFLASITRPFIGLATSAYHVLFLRFFDRIGKGVRSSPRDALLSQSCGEEERGKAFGFQRAMDHAGAMTGPLIASFLMAAFTKDLRIIFVLAFIPSLFCLWILWRGVTDVAPVKPPNPIQQKPSTPPKLNWKEWDRQFKYFLLIITLFTLGNSTDAFLLLRAQDLGLSIVSIPILWFVFHLSKTVFSIPGGALSDRIGRKKVMVLAWTIYGLVYLGFAFSSKAYQVWLLFIVYGFFYGLSEGTEKAWVSDLVEESKRGTAYGAYHFCIGIAALPASLLMGFIWKAVGVQWAFTFGAIMALIAGFLTIVLMKNDQKGNRTR